MGGNSEEAQKAFDRAQQYYDIGNVEKAIKFAEKSLRLCPSDAVRTRLSQYRCHEGKSTSIPSTPSPDESVNYTQEQVDGVRVLLRKKNFYDILGCSQSASPSQIKKVYRKLALKFHPDKNQAPGAEDAFKKIQQAHQCLSDSQKRRHYDQTGEEEPQNARRGRRRRGHNMHDMDDFLFNFFGFHQNRRRQNNQNEEGGQQQQRGGIMQFAHLFPLLLLFLFSILSGTTSDDSPFKLEKTDSYHSRRETPNGAVYYVNSYFNRRYKNDYRGMSSIEIMVNQQYYDKLSTACQTEKKQRLHSISNAQKVRGSSQNIALQKAYSTKTPSCQNLRKLVSSYG